MGYVPVAKLKAFGDKLCCGYRKRSFPLAFRPNLIEAAANTNTHTHIQRQNVQLQQVQADRLNGEKNGKIHLEMLTPMRIQFQRLNQQLNSINFEMFVGCRATRAAAATTTTTTANTC